MNDWVDKADQDLSATDVAEMRKVARRALASGLFKTGWDPPDELPLAETVSLAGTVRRDEVVAQLTFYDPVADRRAVHIRLATALELQVQLAKFIAQVAR